MDTILELQNISKSFDGKTIIKELNLEIYKK